MAQRRTPGYCSRKRARRSGSQRAPAVWRKPRWTSPDSADTLPAAVKATIEKETAGAKVLGIEKEETVAAVKVVKLSKPTVAYEVKMTKDGKTTEVAMDAAGKVTEREEVKDEKDGKDEQK